MDYIRLAKRIFVGLLILSVIAELAWILTHKPSTPTTNRATQVATQNDVPETGGVPVVAPTTITIGLMVRTEAKSAIETGIEGAINAAKSRKIEAAEKLKISRCFTTTPETTASCYGLFKRQNVQAIIANPDVDATPVLDQMTSREGIPYIGSFPTTDIDYNDTHSYQLAAGRRGLLLAPLRWAVDAKSPSIVLVSTNATAEAREEFLTAARRASMPVQAFTFQDVGTNVAPYLTPAGEKRPLVYFLTEDAGCEVILRGLTRRKPSLTGKMEATFIPNACSQAAKTANLDGLGLVTARAFANEIPTSPQAVAEIAGRTTMNAMFETFLPSDWSPLAPSLTKAITQAAEPNPTGSLGAWDCTTRRLNDPASMCGQQTQVVGLGPDTRAIEVWIDSLRTH